MDDEELYSICNAILEKGNPFKAISYLSDQLALNRNMQGMLLKEATASLKAIKAINQGKDGAISALCEMEWLGV